MYEISIMPKAQKFLAKLDKNIQKRIAQKLNQLITNPQLGEPLLGNLSGLWKLRIDKYRIIYKIFNNKLLIIVLKMGHRKNIYN